MSLPTYSTHDPGAYQTNLYCYAVGITITVYDYSLILSREITHIWQRPLSVTTILYLINRYLSAAYNLLLISVLCVRYIQSPSEANNLCVDVTIALGILFTILNVNITIFLSLRIYAIWNKDMRILVFSSIMGMAFVVLTAYTTATQHIAFVPGRSGGCVGYTYLKVVVYDALSITMAVSNLIVSCTIFALIPIKIYVNFRQVVLSEQHEGAKLLILLQKDGTLHLMTILFIDITRLAVLNSQTVVGSMTYIVEAFISILVSRFILDARTVYAQDQGETTLGDQTTLQFANRQDDMSDSAEEYNSQSRISTIRIGFEPSQFGQETLVSRVHIRNAIQSIKDSLAEDEDPGIFV